MESSASGKGERDVAAIRVWRGASFTLFVCAGVKLMVVLRVVSEKLGGIRWEVGARGECEGAMLKHGGGEVMNERKGLGVEIGEHGVRAPAADQTDDALVAAAAQERHGATGAEAACGNISRCKAKMRELASGGLQELGYMSAGDVVPATIVVIGAQGRCGQGVVLA